MSNITLKREWRAPYPTDWRNNFLNFVEACKQMEIRKMEAQYFFSHIIRTEEWHEEKVWEDWVTGEVYENEDDIPLHVDTVSITRRWKTQKSFIDWCADNVPGFADSTFWSRHLVIDKWTEVGMDLVDAVKIVAGLSAFTPSKLILGIFDFDDYHRCIGYKPELASKLPTLTDEARENIEKLAGRNPEDIEDEIAESLPDVARAAEEYIKEKSFPIEQRNATSRSISSDIRKEITREPKCHIQYSVDDSPHHWVWIIEYPGEGGYTERTEKIYIQLISKDGEVLSPDDLPEEALTWWHEKFHLWKQLQRMS